MADRIMAVAIMSMMMIIWQGKVIMIKYYYCHSRSTWSPVATTEVFRVGDDSWNFVGNLPRAMSGMRIVIFGNRLLMSGTNSSVDKNVLLHMNY